MMRMVLTRATDRSNFGAAKLLRPTSRRFKFHKRCQLFIGTHNETPGKVRTAVARRLALWRGRRRMACSQRGIGRQFDSLAVIGQSLLPLPC
jgi:hypothetical protein